MKNVIKKIAKIMMTFSYSFVTLATPLTVIANGFENPILQINNITGKDGSNYVTYYDGENLSGKLCVRMSGTNTCLEPNINNETHIATFNFVENDNIQILVVPSEGYNVNQNSYSINGGESQQVPGDKIIGMNELQNSLYIFDISFVGGNNPQEPSSGTSIRLNKLEGKIIETDGNKLVYKSGGNIVGTAKLKIGDNYFAPTLDQEGNPIFDIPDYSGNPYVVNLEVTPELEYSLDRFYHVDGTQYSVPSNNQLAITINSNNEIRVNFDFLETSNTPYPIIESYPIVAYFEGIDDGILVNENDYVVLPNGFTTGKVTFKAKVCDSQNGKIIPDNNTTPCTNKREIAVRNEGIINGVQIKNTVTPINGGIKILNGFEHYGKVSIHITKALLTDPEINTHINVITEDLINVEANSPLEMSYSLGSASTNHAILTVDDTDDIAVFFGNTETKLYANGINVNKITNATGSFKSSTINSDGSVTIEFPDLTKETTTKVELTILMNDGKSIKKTVNLARTAILLQHNYGDGDDSVYAGYVVNKGYLYNNQKHNDQVFNAYLQVILYKDDVVVGYKQIKINDETLINKLHDNESGSLELYSEKQIPIYGKATNDLISGVNKVSAFLTDGPINFNGETLPSIEFGIGSGVTLDWEAK